MVSQGSVILDDDVNTIINAINGEEDARGLGLDNIQTVPTPFLIDNQKFLDIISRNESVNASHCYCQGQSSIETHNGGVAISLQATTTGYAQYFEDGDPIRADYITDISEDVASLIAQCDCNSYGCTCDTNAPTTCGCYVYNQMYVEECCSCNKVCICNSVCYCEFECTCNIDCTCDNVCTCEYGG